MRATYSALLFAVLITITGCSATEPALHSAAEPADLANLNEIPGITRGNSIHPGSQCPSRQNLWCTAGANGANCRCVDSAETQRRIGGRSQQRY